MELASQQITTTTTTVKTTITYPPLRVPPAKDSLQQQPKAYPLASTELPRELSKFAMEVNGQEVVFQEQEVARAMTPSYAQDAEELLESFATRRSGSPPSTPLQRRPRSPLMSPATETETATEPLPSSSQLTATYSLPSILSTYDQLPPSLQTYLLFQLLRRTPRPSLQFTAQTILPVLHRDFLGEMPQECSHHILRFATTRTLCRMSCVASKWQQVVEEDRAVWKARLLDARYVARDHPRAHPLSYRLFGLHRQLPGPARSPVAGSATDSEISTRDLQCDGGGGGHAAGDIAEPLTGRQLKQLFKRRYRTDQNWSTGQGNSFSFTTQPRPTQPVREIVTCIQLTPRYIIAGFETRGILVFDLRTGRQVRRLAGHEGGVWALAVEGQTVVSGSTDRTVRVWDLETGQCTHVLRGHTSTVRCLQIVLPADVRTPKERMRGCAARYEPSRPLLVTGSRDTTLRVWVLPSPLDDTVEEEVDPLFRLNGHTESVRAVCAFGNLVFSGSYDNTVRVWDLRTGALVHRLEGHTAKVYTLTLDPDHRLVISGSMDGSIRCWDWVAGKCLRILRGHLTLVGLLDMNHGQLVSAGADMSLRVWDHPMDAIDREDEAYKPLNTLDPAPPPPPITSQQILVGQPNNFQQLRLLQELQTQQRINDQLHFQQLPSSLPSDYIRHERVGFRQHTNAITCFAHDGTKLVSGADTTLKLWDLRSGRFVRDIITDLSNVWQVKFMDGRLVAAVQRNEVTYFEVIEF